jgi:hypothetical protein
MAKKKSVKKAKTMKKAKKAKAAPLRGRGKKVAKKKPVKEVKKAAGKKKAKAMKQAPKKAVKKVAPKKVAASKPTLPKVSKVVPTIVNKPQKKAVKLAKPDAGNKRPAGVITHYYDKIGVGVLKLAEPIHVGDMIRIRRGEFEFTQIVKSMQINRKPVAAAKANDDVAIKVDKPAHEGARIFKA